MTWIILQFLFLAMPVAITSALYKSNRRFMDRFYERMVRNEKARKLHTWVLLTVLLLYHYVYTNGHPGEFGIVFSTIVCAALASYRRTDRWLRYLLDRPRAFAIYALVAVVIAGIPHLHALAVTISFVLLAALFYPSVRVMSEWKENDMDKIFKWVEHPRDICRKLSRQSSRNVAARSGQRNLISPNNFHNDKSSKKESK